MSRATWLTGALLLALAVAGIAFGNGYQLFVLSLMGLTATVGIGLNILVGMTGQISLGHVGFYAIGAYAVAVPTTAHGWSFWAALPLAGVLAGLAGALLSLPALRARGPYLAMVTIAFGFIVEQSAAELDGLTGGWNGIMGIAPPEAFGRPLGPRGIAVLVLLVTVLSLGFHAVFGRSVHGQALRALRDSEVASRSAGLDPVRLRVVAFALSAVFAGVAGGIYAVTTAFVSPESFPFFESVLFLLVVMVGGADRLLGPVVGAVIVVLLPELFSWLAEYRLLFVGALLLVVLRIAPDGVVGAAEAWAGRLSRNRSAVPEPVGAPADDDPSAPIGPRAPRALSVAGLSIRFGGVRALEGIGFRAEPGRVTSLIGPNGAGKTTALNLVTGLYAPDAGEVRLGKERLDGRSPHAIARAGVARTYQSTQLFERMSVLENVLVPMGAGRTGPASSVARLDTDERVGRAQALLAFAGYRGDPNARAGALAHVDKRLVEIARALAGAPEILLLDEPAAGLGEADTTRLAAVLRAVADAGIGVVLIEHDMALVMSVSDHVVVLDAGRCIAAGSPGAVRADPTVRAAYLGERRTGVAARDVLRVEGGTAVLAAHGLRCGYGASEVLRGVDLHVGRGELVAVLGANGAGKSTLMRALAGLHRPVSGAILLEGRDVSAETADARARAGLALVPEGRQVFPELDVLRNIRVGAHGRPPADLDGAIERMLDRYPRLRERAGQRAGLLSGGEQQMLAIARGLVAGPRVLLLDEPSLGLAPALVDALYADLAALRDDGATILLVDQTVDAALAVADHAHVLSGGRFSASGTAASIRRSPHLDEAYLGADGAPRSAAGATP